MKLDCQQVLTQFASFSVEELSDSEAATLLHHLEECEPCKGQWLLFEKSLTVVTQSGPRDEDVEQHRSQQMWLVCMDHARKNVEKKSALPAKSAVSQLVSTHNVESEMTEHSADKSQKAAVLTATRVGITLFGGALLILTSSYSLVSQPTPNATSPSATSQIVAFAALSDSSTAIFAAPNFGHTSALSAPLKTDYSLIAAPTRKLIAPPTFANRA